MDPVPSLHARAIQASMDPMGVPVSNVMPIPSVLVEIPSLLAHLTLSHLHKAQIQPPVIVIGDMRGWKMRPVLHALSTHGVGLEYAIRVR